MRWRTVKVAEYELDTDMWELTDAQITHNFLPFSRTVYLPSNDMLNLGGFDDS